MSLTLYGEREAERERLQECRVAVIGYGNQGRAHALNLRDAGHPVAVGQRPGRAFERAVEDGFEPASIEEAVGVADLVILGLPDESASEAYQRHIGPHLSAGQALGFVHGFNIRYGYIRPAEDVDVVMVAPKGPGTLVRSTYVAGKGLPALLAIHQDATGQALATALTWAHGIGSTRATVIRSTFAAETETDLFGEQVVLCGGVSALAKAAFETLVEAGYEPEFAYLECVHELKQVVDLLYARGLAGMRQRVSNTAEYGDLTRGPRVIDDAVRQKMRQILKEIRSGEFAQEWIDEHRSGGKRLQSLFEADADSEFERTGERVRGFMPWLAAEG